MPETGQSIPGESSPALNNGRITSIDLHAGGHLLLAFFCNKSMLLTHAPCGPLEPPEQWKSKAVLQKEPSFFFCRKQVKYKKCDLYIC